LKAYITFGQTHQHSVDGKMLDKDTVARIEVASPDEAVAFAMRTFGGVYSRIFIGGEWKPDNLKYYPKGYVDLG